VEAIQERRPAVVHVFLWLGVVLFAVARVASWIPGGVANQIHALGVHPLFGQVRPTDRREREHQHAILDRRGLPRGRFDGFSRLTRNQLIGCLEVARKVIKQENSIGSVNSTI
jgi:hypothetical protein